MRFPRLVCIALLLVGTLPLDTFAAAETTKPSATAPPAEPAKVYAPSDLDALRMAIGQTVAVEGTIVASGESKTKTVRYLNFTKNYKESLGLVFFVSKGGEEFAMEKVAAWVGKKIRASGKVAEHNGALQIEIEKWEQVQEIQ
ncbi:MAG: hypothetical protein WCF18_15820 [Chthoniobacteraceae bacterium]